MLKPLVKKAVEGNSRRVSVMHSALQRLGFHVAQGPNALVALLEMYNVGVVFDVGANLGQYARHLRLNGYRRRIISFEPTSSSFRLLSKRLAGDPDWCGVHLALGDKAGSAMLNVFDQHGYNSLLPLIDAASQPRQEQVPVERFDYAARSYFDREIRERTGFFLKLDTQGYERRVLDGASDVFDKICGVQLEVTFRRMYRDEPLADEMIPYLSDRGFTLVAMSPLREMLTRGKRDRDPSFVSQADALFFRLPGL